VPWQSQPLYGQSVIRQRRVGGDGLRQLQADRLELLSLDQLVDDAVLRQPRRGDRLGGE